MARLVSGNRAGGAATLSADKVTYLTTVASGALIATLTDPYGGGSTFSVVGAAPATLALASGGRIVAGAGAQTADQASTIVIRAAKGQRSVEEPILLTARAPVVVTPTPTPTPAALDLALYGITDWTPGLTVRRISAGQYDVAESAESMRPSALGGTLAIVHVNNNTGVGNNANPGTQASPFLSVPSGLALTTADTIRILVTPLEPRICWGGRAWPGTIPAGKNIEIEAADGGELIFAKTQATSAPVITANGDGTYTLSSGITSTSTTHASPLMDFSPATRAANGGQPRPYAHTQGTTAPDAALRASLTPGQSYRSTAMSGASDTVFRPFGDRALSTFDGYLIPTCISGMSLNNQLPANATAGYTVFSKNVHWVGGTVGGLNLQAGAGLRQRGIMSGGGIWAASGGNGFGPIGAQDWYLFNVAVGYHWADALNTHSNASGDCMARYVGVSTRFTGYSNSGTDNAATGHDGPAGTPTPLGPLGSRDLYVGCTLEGSNGRVLGYVGSGRATVFGGSIAGSTRTTTFSETVSASDQARVALVEVGIGASGGAFELNAAAPAMLRCFGMTQGATRISGDVTFQALPIAG